METLAYLLLGAIGLVLIGLGNHRLMEQNGPELDAERRLIQKEMAEEVTEDLDRFFDSLTLPTEETPHDKETTSEKEEALSS